MSTRNAGPRSGTTGRTSADRARADRTAADRASAGGAGVVALSRWRLLRSRWGRRLIGLLVLAAIGGLVWLVEFSPVLALQTVRVDGGSGTIDRQVRRSLALAPGRPLARIDVGAVAHRVAGRVPTVRTVTVHRTWPSTITVTVSPRVAVLAMPTGSGWALLDDQAVVVAHRKAAPANLPVLTHAGDPAAVAGAAAVVAALPKSLHAKVASITAETADSITLHTPKGVTVVWGSPEQSARKARVLAALISHDARVYDVSSPDLPTTRQ